MSASAEKGHSVEWTVTERQGGRITEYTSADGRWRIWSQPFTPVWRLYEGGSWAGDFVRVSDAKAEAAA